MLLRRFATDDERLVMAAREAPHEARPTSVRKACAEVGFYAIPTEELDPQAREDHDPEVAERVLAGVESATSALLDELTEGRLPQDEDDRITLALFAALQMTRGWQFRRDLDDMVNASAMREIRARTDDARVRAFLRDRGDAYDDAAVRDFHERLRTNPPRIVMGHGSVVQTSVQHAVEQVLPVLLTRPWHLLRFDRPLLLTSDAAIAPWSPPSPAGTPSPALMTARAVFLPVDRQTCLAFGSTGGDRVEQARPARAKRINLAVASAATRWVFHHPDDRPLDHLVVPPPTVLVDELVDRVLEPGGIVREKRMFVRRVPEPQP